MYGLSKTRGGPGTLLADPAVDGEFGVVSERTPNDDTRQIHRVALSDHTLGRWANSPAATAMTNAPEYGERT